MLNNPFFSLLFGANGQSQSTGNSSPKRNDPTMGLTTASGGSQTGFPQTQLFFSGSPNSDQHPPGDQLALFRQQMQLGLINPNLNQPALPYYSNQGWVG